MNKTKIIDYIQVLFWICVLVAGAIGAYTHLSWGYIDWVVIGQTVLVFTNAFGWIAFILEAKIFRKKNTDIFLALIFFLLPILFFFINLNKLFKGGDDVMVILLMFIIFFGSMIGMRYGIITVLGYTTTFYLFDEYYSFNLGEYIYNFLALYGFCVGILISRFVAKKVIFRRWSDVLVKQEQKRL